MPNRLLLKPWKMFLAWQRRDAEVRFLATLSDHELKELRLDQKTIRRIRSIAGVHIDDSTRNPF